MDISMSGLGGIEATRRIKKEFPSVKVLVLSMFDDESYLRQVLEAGGTGYMLKKAADTELLSAIRAVSRGEVFLYPSLTKALVEELFHKRPSEREHEKEGFERLSEREREVLRLIALGHTNQQVADMLFLSVKTVETYKARLVEKLKLRGRADLVRYAMEKGLLTEESR